MPSQTLYLRYLSASQQISFFADQAGTQPRDTVIAENGVVTDFTVAPTTTSDSYTPFGMTFWSDTGLGYSFTEAHPVTSPVVLMPGATLTDTTFGATDFLFLIDNQRTQPGPQTEHFEVTILTQDGLLTSRDPQIELEGTN